MYLLIRRISKNDVALRIDDGVIVPLAEKPHPRANWDKLFQEAIINGHEPENDLFDGISNDFNQTEWQ